jgi:hypothetical protein
MCVDSSTSRSSSYRSIPFIHIYYSYCSIFICSSLPGVDVVVGVVFVDAAAIADVSILSSFCCCVDLHVVIVPPLPDGTQLVVDDDDDEVDAFFDFHNFILCSPVPPFISLSI